MIKGLALLASAGIVMCAAAHARDLTIDNVTIVSAERREPLRGATVHPARTGARPRGTCRGCGRAWNIATANGSAAVNRPQGACGSNL